MSNTINDLDKTTLFADSIKTKTSYIAVTRSFSLLLV